MHVQWELGGHFMTAPIDLWTGEFGDNYTERNKGIETVAARISMFKTILEHTRGVESIMEVGANVGHNIIALRAIDPGLHIAAIEPNETARTQCAKIADNVWARDISKNADRPGGGRLYNLVFTRGVLVHIHPDDLHTACSNIYELSNRYILSCEYFSDEPREKRYRETDNSLWLRDYGLFWLENFNLSYVAHGFCWRPIDGLENITWWLFRK